MRSFSLFIRFTLLMTDLFIPIPQSTTVSLPSLHQCRCPHPFPLCGPLSAPAFMWSLCIILVALVTIAVSAAAPPADTFDVSTCTYMSPATGTSFDLSALTLPEADSYSIRDPYSGNKNITFFFNICGATRKPDTALCTGDIAAAYRFDAPPRFDATPTCTSMGYIKGTKVRLRTPLPA